MNRSTTNLDALPRVLSIFPLTGAVLLPRERLTLNVFEPRYLELVQDALGAGRLIGMIQPREGAGENAPPALYDVGCAGRIAVFQETDDGRFLIQLIGVSRFRVSAELPGRGGYRRIAPAWGEFAADLENALQPGISLSQLEQDLTRFLAARRLEVSWRALRKMKPAPLVDFLAVNLPFAAREKQALVEAPTVVERARLLQSALAMETRATGTGEQTRH